jgi:hypothetical protein
MGYNGIGVALLMLAILGYATACILIGFVFLAAAYIWWLVDLIMICTNGLPMADGTPLR